MDTELLLTSKPGDLWPFLLKVTTSLGLHLKDGFSLFTSAAPAFF